MLHAAYPNQPYRLSFVAVAGYGYPKKVRTVELWHNGQKFDDVVVDGAAKVISKPFYPTGDVQLLVMKVKEQVRPIPRTARLWNKEIPGDYRKLNVLAAGIKVYPPVQPAYEGSTLADFQGASLFEHSLTFNGLMADRWVRQTLAIQLPYPLGSNSLELELNLPAVPGFR